MAPRPETTAMLDRWLTERLREQYDAALREPLPETLVKLLEERG